MAGPSSEARAREEAEREYPETALPPWNIRREAERRAFIAGAEWERSQVAALIQDALNELGVPNEDYPAPVANAVATLRALSATADSSEGGEGNG